MLFLKYLVWNTLICYSLSWRNILRFYSVDLQVIWVYLWIIVLSLNRYTSPLALLIRSVLTILSRVVSEPFDINLFLFLVWRLIKFRFISFILGISVLIYNTGQILLFWIIIFEILCTFLVVQLIVTCSNQWPAASTLYQLLEYFIFLCFSSCEFRLKLYFRHFYF